MGRGRAKAKQTKVARELKYRGSGTDLDALRAELASAHDHDAAGHSAAPASSTDDEDDDDEFDDRWSDRWADEDDDEDEQPARRSS